MGTHPIFESDFDCLTEIMEWDGLDQALPNEIAKFDQAQVARLRSQLLHQSNYHHQTKAATNKASCTMLKEIIDELGHRSGRAQGLGHSITTFDKFAFGDRHTIYILRDRPPARKMQVSDEKENGEEEGEEEAQRAAPGKVYGFIKIGHKPLFVMDANGNQLEVNPLCVLDFYVLEEYQRNGFGLKLFANMLRDQSINPAQLAIDRPSAKFRAFLKKHYGLARNIPQVNNFVIFDGFFKLNPVRRNRNRLFDDFNDRRVKSGNIDRRKVTTPSSHHYHAMVERQKTLPVAVTPPSLPAIHQPPASIMLQPRREPIRNKYGHQWAPQQRNSRRSQQRINTAFNIFGVRSNYS